MWVSDDKMFKVEDTAHFLMETVLNWTLVSGSHPKLSARTYRTSQSVLCFTKLTLLIRGWDAGQTSLKPASTSPYSHSSDSSLSVAPHSPHSLA